MKKAQTETAGTLVEVLLREGLISKTQLEEALRVHQTTERPLARILVEMGAITESAKMSILKKTFGYELVSLVTEDLDKHTLKLIPQPIAFRHHVIPVRVENDTLVLAMEDPSNLVLIDNLKALVGLKIKPVIASGMDIDEALKSFPAEEGPRRVRSSFILKMLKVLFLPVVGLAPLPLFILILIQSGSLQVKLARLSAFDFILYFILGLGLWALIIWEINGLLFKSRQ